MGFGERARFYQHKNQMFKRFPQKLLICFYSSAVLFDDSELKEPTPSTSSSYLEVIKDYKLYFS